MSVEIANIQSLQPFPLPIISQKERFNKYTVKIVNNIGKCFDTQGRKVVLADLDLTGSIAFTEDKKHIGWLHKLIYVSQRIFDFFRGYKNERVNHNLCHGIIVLNPINDKVFAIAHSVLPGIKTGKIAFSEHDHQNIQIFQPQSKELRDEMVKNAAATAYTPKQFRIIEDGEYKVKKATFSIKDMLKSFFKSQGPINGERARKRLAHDVAHIYMGKQFLNKKSKPKSYFCTPYALTVLQSSILSRVINPDDVEGMNKNTLADYIFRVISGKTGRDTQLFQTFNENDVCKLDGRFSMTSYTVNTLEKAL